MAKAAADHQLAPDQPLHKTGQESQKAIRVQPGDTEEMPCRLLLQRSLSLGGLLLTPRFPVGGIP